MTLDLHPYDRVRRRFCHTDAAQDQGRALVARVLGLPAPPAGELLYDLSFFSGGFGIIDHLAITLLSDGALWSHVAGSLRARTLVEAAADQSWAGDLIGLLTGDEEAVPLRLAAIQFINQHRREFQAECVQASCILFEYESNVNDWVVLWGEETRLNYLGYRQG